MATQDDADQKLAKTRSRLSIGAVRSPESTNAILEAAAQVLEERGYRAFTLDAVVERAGSSKPTIYRWWGNKANLIRDVYERSGETLLATPQTGILENDLKEHLHSLWNWWDTTRAGETLRGFITEMQLNPESLAEFQSEFLPRREQILKKIFERAIEVNEIPAGSDISTATSMLTGLSWLSLLTRKLENKEQLDQAINLLVAGLKSTRP